MVKTTCGSTMSYCGSSYEVHYKTRNGRVMQGERDAYLDVDGAEQHNRPVEENAQGRSRAE